MVESEVTTMTYVLDVKTSMKAAKLELRTSMLWNWAANLLPQPTTKKKQTKQNMKSVIEEMSLGREKEETKANEGCQARQGCRGCQTCS